MKRRAWLLVAAIATGLIVLAACSPATAPPQATPTRAVDQTQIAVQTQVVDVTSLPAHTPTAEAAATQVTEPTFAPTETQPVLTPLPSTTPAATAEGRVVELEWPPAMRLGDSDIVRVSIIPALDAVEVVTEFEDHSTITESVAIPQLTGFDLAAVARLDAAGFETDPAGEQMQTLVAGQPATWRWTLRPIAAGQQRIAVSVRLRWLPQANNPAPLREAPLYSRGLTVQVQSFLGLTTRELAVVGLVGLAFGCTLSLPLAAYTLRPKRGPVVQLVASNPAVTLETPPGLALAPVEANLLRALFGSYGRLVIAAEFRSGYSGARTLLAQPIRPDGRADAFTIAKLGERGAIEREFENYETFVKDTLPPITARIQARPVALRAPRSNGSSASRESAALRYTFIGEAGQSPASLGATLAADPDPALLEKLFATFGPNWWLQRRPFTFRLAQEYDRLLPTHFVLEPAAPGALVTRLLDGRRPAEEAGLVIGDIVRLEHLQPYEVRPDGISQTLYGEAAPGQPALRARWLSLAPAAGAVARVVGTRASLLAELVSGFDRLGLPDPLAALPKLLGESITGTQATIHGDLNLENVLVGPGGFVWLIDFAQTRDGHTLFDFAYLEAALIAQTLAVPVNATTGDYAALAAGQHPLQSPIRAMVSRCLFDPGKPREYQLALLMACLGGLKFTNLDIAQKRRLYLTAAAITANL